MRFAQALTPPQLVCQRANPCRPLQHTASPFRQPSGPHAFPVGTGTSFRAEARTPFRSGPAFRPRPAHSSGLGHAGPPYSSGPRLRAPLQARPRGACTPYRAGPVRPTARGMYGLLGRACTPLLAGPVGPSGLGRAGPAHSSGPSRAPLPGRGCTPSGPSPLTLSGGAGPAPCAWRIRCGPAQAFFRNTCGLSASEPSRMWAFSPRLFTVRNTFSLRGRR